MQRKLSRRGVMAGLLPVIAATSAVCQSKDVVQEAADNLARAMSKRHGGKWAALVDHDTGFIMIKPRPSRALL